MEFLKQLKKTENLNNEFLRAKGNNSCDHHLNTLKHYAAVELRYSDQLNRIKLGEDVILALFLKSDEIPLLSKRLVLMFLVSKEHARVSDTHTVCNVLSLRIRHVTLQRLDVSGCCP